jgi:ABC-2 type transport system ATP-binding protein
MLDEPTSNLDPTVRATVLAVIREAKSAGRTVIFSSHILSEVEQVCDRVVILRNGLLVHDQVMAEIRRRHRIHARLTAALPPPPENLAKDLAIMQNTNDTVTIETPGELSPLLGWLASLPLAEVRIEPLGLAGVYEQYHPLEHAA